MSSIYDSIFLVRIDNPDAPGLMKTHPNGVDLGKDAFEFCSSCWPFSDDVIPSNKASLIFSFSVGSSYYHVYLFIFAGVPYEIIIGTRRPFSYLLTSFLKDVKKQFSSSGEFQDPTCRFTYVFSLMSSWPRGAVENAILTFPESSLAITFDYTHFSYAQYDPLRYFSPDQCFAIWHSIFTGHPLLIISNSADVGSKSCFAAYSLISPLLFADDDVIWLRKSDPRYQKILAGSTEYKVVCASYENIAENCSQFKVIRASDGRKSNVNSESSIREVFSKLTTRILRIIISELDNLLTIDAYSDFLGINFSHEGFKEILRTINSPELPSFEDFQMFEKTNTFKKWRHAQALRESLRNAILSYIPHNSFKDKSVHELSLIIEGIEAMKVKHWNDAHMLAVLQKHEKHVVRQIVKKQSH